MISFSVKYLPEYFNACYLKKYVGFTCSIIDISKQISVIFTFNSKINSFENEFFESI